MRFPPQRVEDNALHPEATILAINSALDGCPGPVCGSKPFVNMPPLLTAFRRSLSDCNQSPVRYLGLALLADLPVTVAIAFLLNRVTGTTWPEFSADTRPRVLLAMCVFAPLVETFGMAILIWVLRRVMKCAAYLPLVTALVCAGLHSCTHCTTCCRRWS